MSTSSDSLARLRPAAHHALMNQASFFASSDDFDRGSQRRRGSRQKFGLIRCVANRAGRHRAHARHVQLAIDLRHAGQHPHGVLNRLVAEPAVLKNARAQARDLAIGRQRDGLAPRDHLRGEHSSRVAADVHRRVAHS